jgi:hypothetical protein
MTLLPGLMSRVAPGAWVSLILVPSVSGPNVAALPVSLKVIPQDRPDPLSEAFRI